MNDGILENFLRRWSTMDITPENEILFEEHRASVRALVGEKELSGLGSRTGRKGFAARLAALKGF